MVPETGLPSIAIPTPSWERLQSRCFDSYPHKSIATEVAPTKAFFLVLSLFIIVFITERLLLHGMSQ